MIAITISILPFQVDNKLHAHPSLFTPDRIITLRYYPPLYCFIGHDSGNSRQLPPSHFPQVRIEGAVKLDIRPLEAVVNRLMDNLDARRLESLHLVGEVVLQGSFPVHVCRGTVKTASKW